MTIHTGAFGAEGGTPRQWDTGAPLAAVTVTAGAARSGTYGLRLNPSAASCHTDRQLAPSPARQFVGRLYKRFPSALPAADSFLWRWPETAQSYRLRFESSDSTLRMGHYNSGGTLEEEQTGPVIAAGAWVRIDFTIFLASHSGGGTNKRLEWQVDGVAQTTVGPNSGYVGGGSNWRLGDAASQTFDLNIDDAVYAYTNDLADEATVDGLYPFGEGYVKRLATTGVGTHANATSFGTSTGTIADSWQLLDDLPIDTVTGYVEQTTIGGSDYLEYILDDLTTDEVPNALQVYFARRSSASLSNNAGIHVVDGATDNAIYDSTWLDSSSPWSISQNSVPGLPWSRDRVNALLLRFGYSDDVDSIPRLPAALIEVDVTLTPSQIGGGSGIPGQALVSSSQGWRPQPDVDFTVDELHVDAADWALRSSAFGGYMTGEFTIPASQVRRHSFGISAGAPVAAYTQTGTQVWEGLVAHDPYIDDDGTARIETIGPWADAEAAAEVLCYQVRGGRRFAEGDEDPHNYPQNDGYILGQGGGKLQWKAPKGEDFVADQVASFVLWIPGASFDRYSFIMNKNRDITNFDIRVRAGVGPSGSLTTIDTYTLGAGNPTGTEKVQSGLGGNYDLLAIQILCSSDISALPERLRVWLTSVRVNDRAVDDDMSASDIVTDVGEALGWNTTGIESTAANVLPLVWEEHWSELLLYMADLEDHYVRRDADGLGFGPWGGQTWEILRSFSAVPDLRALKVYNRAVIRYQNMAGKPIEAFFDADPDPIPGRTEVIDYDLADSQPSGDLAEAVGERMIARYSQQRYAGTIDVYRARHKMGPLAIRPGDVGDVLDWGMAEAKALRIHEIEQRHDHARLSIESPISTMRLLEEARRGLGRPRRRRNR